MRSWILFPALILAAVSTMTAGVSPATVRAAAGYSASQGGKSFLVIQHGQTLFEQSAGEPRKIYSGTKAFGIWPRSLPLRMVC